MAQMKQHIKTPFLICLAIGVGFAVFCCSLDGTKKSYLLAERLLSDGSYIAAVNEFEKVFSRDPKGALGQKALFRAAMTQMLYLSQNDLAIRKFNTIIETSNDKDVVWEAKKYIGEILFSKLEDYAQSLQYYQSVLKSNPSANEAPEFLFRTGRSYFFLSKFSEALGVYEEIRKKYSQSIWAEKALLEEGLSMFTRGEKGGVKSKQLSDFQKGVALYEDFIKLYPKSVGVVQARFGIASCLEEMEQLDTAFEKFKELRSSYPAPEVIDIKLRRIAERRVQQKAN